MSHTHTADLFVFLWIFPKKQEYAFTIVFAFFHTCACQCVVGCAALKEDTDMRESSEFHELS